jgi:predicted dehydrogenase
VPEPLDLAFAGAGWIAGVHGFALQHVADAQVTAVASRTPERAQTFAGRAGAEVVAYEDLPAGAAGVVVCTPPDRHAADTLHAVTAGAGVLLEKPLCTTLADADALVEAAEAGATIAYAENLLHAPIVELAMAHAQQLTGIDVLEVRALQDRPSWGEFLTDGWGGGVLFDLGVHPLAVALVLAAPAQPVAVRAWLEGAADHPVDEHADLELRFDTGLVGRITTSWRGGDTPVWDAQVSAPDGVVRLELLPGLLLERDGEPLLVPPPPEGVFPQLAELGYVVQMQRFVGDVRAGRPAAIGPAFGRAVLDVVCGAYASAGAGNEWVELPFSGPRDARPLDLWR